MPDGTVVEASYQGELPNSAALPARGRFIGEEWSTGKRGAAAALERLEASEEEAHRRLQAALTRGDHLGGSGFLAEMQ